MLRVEDRNIHTVSPDFAVDLIGNVSSQLEFKTGEY